MTANPSYLIYVLKYYDSGDRSSFVGLFLFRFNAYSPQDLVAAPILQRNTFLVLTPKDLFYRSPVYRNQVMGSRV